MNKADEDPCETTDITQGFCETGMCTPCDVNNAACNYPGWTAMEPGVSADLLALWVAGPREVYILGKTGAFVQPLEWQDMDGPSVGWPRHEVARRCERERYLGDRHDDRLPLQWNELDRRASSHELDPRRVGRRAK